MKKTLLLVGFALASAVSVQADENTTSPYTGISLEDALVANEKVYLYNVESGLWLQNNDRTLGAWTTRGELDSRGFDVAISALGDGYVINPRFGNNGSMNDNNGHGGELYLDTDAGQSPWVITACDDDFIGVAVSHPYRIQSSNGTDYLHATPETDGFRLIVNDVAARHTWQFVTKSERLEKMLAAGSGADATWLIDNPAFGAGDERRSSWTLTDGNGGNVENNSWWGGQSDQYANAVFETWNNGSRRYTNIVLAQTVALPNGKYQVQMQGAYSPTNGAANGGTNADDMAAYEAGTLKNLGWFFAGNQQTQLPSIYSEAKDASETGFEKQVGEKWIPADVGQFARDVAKTNGNGYYTTEALTVTVTDGNLTLGAKIADADNSDWSWMMVDNFLLTYLGNDIDLSEYLEALEQAIASGETTANEAAKTSAMASQLAEALTTARAARQSTDADEISAATAAVNNLVNAINGMAADVEILRATTELAAADGVVGEPLAAAQDFLANATSTDNYGTILDNLRVARKVANMEEETFEFDGNAPAEGKFYIYNVGRHSYLSSGSDWGTHAVLNWPGLEATLIAADNGFNIQFEELIQGDARDRYLNNSPYVDGAYNDRSTYTFEPVNGEDGVYYIHSNAGYLAFDPNGATDTGVKHYNTVTSFWGQPSNDDAKWKLVTKEDRLALMDEATAEEPVDVTVLIRDASFNKHAALDNPWTDLNQGWEWGNSSFGDKNTETFNSQEYNLSQSVALPRAGVYEVSVQSYYRDGNINPHVERVLSGEPLVETPNLYAGDAATAIVYIHEEADKAPGEGTNTDLGNIPNNMIEASKFFENGCYWNKVTFVVDEPGNVTIGIKKNAGNRDDNWVVSDNFRLAYLGAATTLVDQNADDDGHTIHVLTGTWNAAQFSDIENNDGTMYDLTQVSIPNGTTINTQFENTLLVVTEDQKAAINKDANVLVHVDGLIYKSDNIAFVDNSRRDGRDDVFTFGNGLPFIIQAQKASYSRPNVTGNYGTVVLPFSAPIAEGFRAYELKLKYEEGTRPNSLILQFDEHAGALSQSIPYVLRKGDAGDTSDQVEGKDLYVATNNFGELNIREAEAQANIDDLGGYMMHSTYQTIDMAERAQSAVTAAPEPLYTIAPGNSDKTPLFKECTGYIGPFRGYLTVPEGFNGAKEIIVQFNDEATGIRRATAEEIGELFNVYSIDGKVVKNQAGSVVGLKKGVYIINGKKVVIK